MFDPVVGRFLEEDPSGFAPGDPDLFRYVENAPTNATDPSGLELVVEGDGALSDVLWQIKHVLGWSGSGMEPIVSRLPGDGPPRYLISPGPGLLVGGQVPGNERGDEWPGTVARLSLQNNSYPWEIFWSIGSPNVDRVISRPTEQPGRVDVGYGTGTLTEAQRLAAIVERATFYQFDAIATTRLWLSVDLWTSARNAFASLRCLSYQHAPEAEP